MPLKESSFLDMVIVNHTAGVYYVVVRYESSYSTEKGTGMKTNNVVTAIFNVESEAYQAFVNLRNKPFGENYIVAEAALIKREGDAIKVADSFDVGVTADDTATGMIIGSIAGILGGPMGVLLGASLGGLTGSMLDTDDAIDSISMLEVTSLKLYNDDSAIIALVQEDEPAFDAAFENYDVTIVRHFAADVLDEVDRARELEAELANEARQQLRSKKKAAIKAKKAELDKAFEDAADIAKAEYVASTKEMLGEE